MPEVAAILARDSTTIQKYVKQGLLHVTKNGRSFSFDRDEVIRLAASRGIQVEQAQVPTQRNEVHEDDFFTHLARACRKAPPGVEVTYKAPLPVPA